MQTKILAPFLPLLAAALVWAADWPQFRGPNASGISDETNLPVEFGPDKNVAWKTPLPPGHSSPSVAGDKIFLAAFEGEKLLTIALDRATGRILWRRETPRPRKQALHANNSPASATPASDGKNVYVFFADFGLLAYGPGGDELWRLPLGPFHNQYGPASSPVLSGDTLLLVCDQDTGSFLLAVDKLTGRVRWRTDRPNAQRGYATPVLYQPPGGRPQVVVVGSYRLSAYDVETGKEIWWVSGLPWQIKPTPVVARDIIYFVTFSGESEPGQQEIIPPFAEALEKWDKDKDGKLSPDEVPELKKQWEVLDLDRNGYLEERDWKQYQYRRLGESSLRAYRLGGEGDVTERNLIWKNPRSLPNVPSPLYYQGVLYTLKEGGILTSYDVKTGEMLKQARLPGAPGAQWQILAVNDMGDGCHATPAIAGGRLYLRTHSALYSFAKKD